MTVKSVQIPAQARAVKRRFPDAIVAEAAERVKAGETITLLEEPAETRAACQTEAWYVRQAIAEHLGVDPKGTLRSRTWQTEDGRFSYGVFQRPADDTPTKPAKTAPKP